MVTIDVLGRQHQEVLARLAVVEAQLQTGDGEYDAGGFTVYLRREVMEHFALEEQALFPVLGRHLSPSRGPLAVMNAEHAAFRELLDGLAAAVASGDVERQRAHAREVISLLRSHIAKEDHVLFPMAGRLLSATEQADVDARATTLGGARPAHGS